MAGGGGTGRRHGGRLGRRTDLDGQPEDGRRTTAALRPRRRGEVLDTCLYTTPGRFGGGGAATTWLVGSAADVATALDAYRKLGITHFVLSDTPYKQEIIRIGDQLLPRLR